MKILSICGSPRKGNCESLLTHLKGILEMRGIENTLILLREAEIRPCEGCVEFCNHNLHCSHDDDMEGLMQLMAESDAYLLASPTYFSMPPGILKDFIDKCSVLYTAKTDLSKKKAAVIVVGTDMPSMKQNVANIAGFLETLGVNVVAKAAFKSHSELKGDSDDIFKLNRGLEKELEEIADKLLAKKAP